MWYLNKKTAKEIEKLKIREDFKVQTYKRLFDMFNSYKRRRFNLDTKKQNRFNS